MRERAYRRSLRNDSLGRVSIDKLDEEFKSESIYGENAFEWESYNTNASY